MEKKKKTYDFNVKIKTKSNRAAQSAGKCTHNTN